MPAKWSRMVYSDDFEDLISDLDMRSPANKAGLSYRSLNESDFEEP